jgi:hypothetical protein
VDFFYESIIVDPTNLQIYLQNVLLTATAWAQKGSPDVEPGYSIDRFEMRMFGNGPEKSIILINIPNCSELCDCIQIAIPCMREQAGYYTCELSEDPLDGSRFFIVGEWRQEGGDYIHINPGPLTPESKPFPARVIHLAYGVEYVGHENAG